MAFSAGSVHLCTAAALYWYLDPTEPPISVGFTLPISEAFVYVPLILHIVLPLVGNFVLSWTLLMQGSNHLYGEMVSSC